MQTRYLIAMIPAILSIAACQKDQTSIQTSSNPTNASRTVDTIAVKLNADSIASPPFPQSNANVSNACSALPIYGDSLVYTEPTGTQDDILMPVNNPGNGKFYAWPAGMIIDHNTGAINLSKSQTGMKYIIGFVSAGTTDTCLSTLIIGGAAYFDSAYVVTGGGINAIPYFDANPAGGSNCNGQGDGSGCKFDVTGSAQAASVYVNNSSGNIDLDKTLNGQGNKGGLFGANPYDGQTVTVTFYYQLKHGSNNALERIDVQFMYYASASSIPANLMNSLNAKLSDALNGLTIGTSANPRPPLVIISKRF